MTSTRLENLVVTHPLHLFLMNAFISPIVSNDGTGEM